MEIDQLIIDLSTDPFNPEKNFKAAVEYDRINQTASAVSFYTRAAEYGYKTHPLFVYAALLKMSLCFERQKDRQATVLNNALQAAAYLPERPEAYFLLARIYERSNQWQQCYTTAVLGLTKEESDPLPAFVDYYGKYCLLFEKAISAWWVGRQEESRNLLRKLEAMDTAPEYTMAIKNNLERVGFKTNEKEINPLEPVITNYRKFFGNIAGTIIDIGTRDGNDANYLAKKLNATKVIAIDANPAAVQRTKENYPWMDVYQAAISDYDGQTTFQQVDSGDANMDGCSSLYAEKVASEPQFEGKVNIIPTEVNRMDSFMRDENIASFDVVKVDVEGYTWQVLAGFGDKLSSVKMFHLETEASATHDAHRNNHEVAEFMERQGFALVDISYEGSMGLGKGIEDQLWVNKALVQRNKYCFI